MLLLSHDAVKRAVSIGLAHRPAVCLVKDKPDLGVDPHKGRCHSARDLANTSKAHSDQKGIYSHPAKR